MNFMRGNDMNDNEYYKMINSKSASYKQAILDEARNKTRNEIISNLVDCKTRNSSHCRYSNNCIDCPINIEFNEDIRRLEGEIR